MTIRRDLVALCERLIVDLRETIAALERGDATAAITKIRGAGKRLHETADALTSSDSKEGQKR